MVGWEAWRRYRAAKAKAAGERTVRKLRGRAAVREAENIVEATWVDQLDRAGHQENVHPQLPDLLQRERSAFAEATHRREAEARADRRRLAAIAEEISETTRSVPPVG